MEYLRRSVDKELMEWSKDPFRKPLLLRGARQVGKSSAYLDQPIIAEKTFFGVGRIRSMFMYPFSFDEFLIACDRQLLPDEKMQASSKNPLPEVFHQKLLDYFKHFLVLGGMPQVIARYTYDQDARGLPTAILLKIYIFGAQEALNSNAGVDYLLQSYPNIVPNS